MSFYMDVLQKDPRFGSTQTIRDVSLLEPGTRAAVANIIVMAHADGHELRVGETFRSQARQSQVFKAGASKLKKVGCHGYGVACDLQLILNGKYDPNGEHYAFLRGYCEKAGLISGIGWGTPHAKHYFTDWCHVQRVPIFRQDDLFAGKWYPPVQYDPYSDMRVHGVSGM